MSINKIRDFLLSRKAIVENASYLSVLQIVLLLAPLITYPYLVRVLGMELYGVIVSAQVLVSYASIIIDFGTNSVCTKHVSINRDNPKMLSEIVSSVLLIRSLLSLICFAIYVIVVLLIPAYREFFLLFLLTYGLVLQEILFPQYFFQGIENMKYVTIINVLFKAIFIALIFIVVKSPKDFILVPILYVIGYTVSSVTSIIIIVKMGIKLRMPKLDRVLVYVKDSSPLLATSIIGTIKDKFNYFFFFFSIGMSDVVIYDLGIKLNGLIAKPVNIMEIVMFPRFAKSRNFKNIKRFAVFSFFCSLTMCALLNLFLPFLVDFFLHEQVDMFPIRLLSIAPVILAISGILGNDFMVAFGYNKYVFYSIIFTTCAYITSLLSVIILGLDNSLYAFVYIALISYFAELVYRLYATRKIIKRGIN